MGTRILRFRYNESNRDTTIVHFKNDKYRVEDVFIFKNNIFNTYIVKNSAFPKINLDQLKRDIAGTVVQYMCVPFSDEDLIEDLEVSVHSAIFKIIE